MANTDYFTEVGNPGTATTLAAPGHSIAGTTFNVVSTANWPTTTGVVFAVDTFTIQTVNGVATAVRNPGSYTEWEGDVTNATTIANAVIRFGTDQNYPAGSNTRLYIPVASSRENRLVQGLLVSLNQNGTLKNGSITSSAQILDGTITDADLAIAVKPVTLFNENTFDHVVSGCIWTADAVGSTRNASMTAGIIMLAGKRLTVAAVTARSFTASRDVYVDFSDNGDGTALITYTDNTTNIASPVLAVGSLRNAIVVVGATNIATAASINQGQEDRVLPITASVAYAVTDSLGNLICPRDPNRRIIGYRQVLSNATATAATGSQVTGLSVPVIVPLGRKVKITLFSYRLQNGNAGTLSSLQIWDGVVAAGTLLGRGQYSQPSAPAGGSAVIAEATVTPAVASKTYNAGLASSDNTNTATANADALSPLFMRVELA